MRLLIEVLNFALLSFARLNHLENRWSKVKNKDHLSSAETENGPDLGKIHTYLFAY